ncbi:MAG TPA: glycosyltransferase family 4 protein [Thermoanaerobaculia bacterium]|nr:glycosyltransferase family 4 protein [Thermoanaerobaculia bacterium]
MRITYLLDVPPEVEDVSGLQADALAARGHLVRIAATDRPASLRGGRRAEWIDAGDWAKAAMTAEDVVVATSWRTAAAAERAPLAVHLCQTFDPPPDGAPPLRMAVVGPALREHWARAGANPVDAGVIVDEQMYRRATPRENAPPRLLLAGASHTEVKGVDDGYGAVAHARWFHQKLELVRASPWAPSRQEPLDDVQEFHVGLDSDEMRRLLHSCDLLIAPARAAEGFGMLAAEAMAAGIPCLLTAIPAHLALAEPRDYALFGPERNAVELGEKLIELLGDADLRERLRVRGREVAEQWRAEKAIERLEEILRESPARNGG